MAENLWEIRKRKNMNIKQLAGKVGIPFDTLVAYERGELIPSAHRARLARALFVQVSDIKAQSDPKPPERKATERPSEHKPAERKPDERPVERKPDERPAKQKPAAPPKAKMATMKPARSSQIAHLLQLAAKLDEDETAVTNKIGKPLHELTLPEASKWLHEYTTAIMQDNVTRTEKRPLGTRRKRAYLPESVDEFELNYLTAQQQAGNVLSFHLLNGEVFHGRVIGFSPYAITIQQEADGVQMMVQKLALAYYSAPPQEANT